MGRAVLAELPAASLLLTGGNPRRGVTEAARMTEVARALGVPPDRIVVEPHARTTEENARYSADIMVDRGLRHGLLVSHGLHLGYAVPVFEAEFGRRGLNLYWRPVERRIARDFAA